MKIAIAVRSQFLRWIDKPWEKNGIKYMAFFLRCKLQLNLNIGKNESIACSVSLNEIDIPLYLDFEH